MSTAATPLSSRRHDLDALRGVAMLLGIVLHGAISFIPLGGAGWAVQDSQTSGMFAVLLAAIHGFRMPLFFLISGFFTAMLWRKRGLSALLAHRFQRIFLPMVIALFTIIPATWAVSIYIKFDDAKGSSAAANVDPAADLLAAVCHGKTNTIRSQIASGADLNEKNSNGSTPLHVAVFFGRAEAAKILIEAGAEVDALDANGNRPADLLASPWGLTAAIAKSINVKVEQQELREGRTQIAELLGERTALPDQVVSKVNQADSAVTQSDGLYGLLVYVPLFGHLWFLWFLCWLVMGFAICVTAGRIAGLGRPPRWLTLSGSRYLWLIPLTAVPQYLMSHQGNNFGPDTSLGLLPIPAVLGYYAIFFGFGALYYDAGDQQGSLGQKWWITIPTAILVVFPLGLAIGGQADGIGRLTSVLSQVVYVWLMSFGLMGLFRKLLWRESATMRYLSDSSYWLYLAHIPLIIYVQYIVRDWPFSAWIKFPLVCLVTSGLLLLSYQVFVRYTPIGTLLNGPRRRPTSAIPTAELVSQAEIVRAHTVLS